MIKLSATIVSVGSGLIMFWCPGCNGNHVVQVEHNAGWTWDGNVDAPTINPSVLTTSGHYSQGSNGCWCEYYKNNPSEDGDEFKCVRCHSFIKKGMIEFLNDSSHHLAGQTVPLPVYPKELISVETNIIE